MRFAVAKKHALAAGALALGTLTIGRLAIGRARIRRLEVDELVVHKLHFADLRTFERAFHWHTGQCAQAARKRLRDGTLRRSRPS